MSLEISLNLNSQIETEEASAKTSSSLLYRASIATILAGSLYKISQTDTFSALSGALKQKISTLNMKVLTPTKNQALLAGAGLGALAVQQRNKIKKITIDGLSLTADLFKKAKTNAKKGLHKYKQRWESNTLSMLAIHIVALAILATTVIYLKNNFNQENQTDKTTLPIPNNDIENSSKTDDKNAADQFIEKASSKTKNAYESTKNFFFNIKNKASEKIASCYEKLGIEMESKTDYPYTPSHNNDFSWLYETPSEEEDETKLTNKK